MDDTIKTTAEIEEDGVFPRAHAVHTDPTMASAEQKPLPAKLAGKSVKNKSPAEWAYERLVLYIRNFEEQLDNQHEVAIGMTGGDAGVLKIEGLGYFDPDIVTFYGTDPSGAKTQLIQHVSQLNVMLRAMPLQTSEPEQEPNRIGFRLAQDLEVE
ncbi:MAG: DUF6173 family protein [Pseudoruegeria sp.]